MFIHYTGPSRKVNLKSHNYGYILKYFVKRFYKNNSLHYHTSESIRKIKYYYKWVRKRVKLKLINLFKKILLHIKK